MTVGGEFRYREVDGWPPLAWLAECRPGDAEVRVFHGPRVETEEDWFGEVVWDGPLDEAGFDRTDVVFGSGARRRDGDVVFVSAGTTVDRLQQCRRGGSVWISNSLVCLMATLDLDVDPTYDGYLYDFRSVIEGIGRYEPVVETTAEDVRLTYYRNLRWDGDDVEEVDKPRPERRFESFESYRGCLADAMERIAGNLSDSGRDHPFRMLGTISSGYDSPAVAALCREAGLDEAVTFGMARRGMEDSGEAIGDALGIDVRNCSHTDWQEDPFASVPFVAGSATAGEIFFKGAEESLPGTVLMTGEYGGNVWTRRLYDPDGVLATTDPAGLSLTEFRLWTGFIHCPVPYIGARGARDVVRISRSEEMLPWSVGGYYDRPIPRRIAEEAGVPREAFGQSKAYGAVSFSHPDLFWSRPSVRDFTSWLDENRQEWARRGKIPPQYISAAARPLQRAARAIVEGLEPLTGGAGDEFALLSKLRFAAEREYLFKFMFPWALERAKERYRTDDAIRTPDASSGGPGGNGSEASPGAAPRESRASGRSPATAGGERDRGDVR